MSTVFRKMKTAELIEAARYRPGDIGPRLAHAGMAAMELYRRGYSAEWKKVRSVSKEEKAPKRVSREASQPSPYSQ